jgi:hypothetical protein
MAAKALRRYNFQAPKTKTRWRTRTVTAGRRGVSAAVTAAREEKHTIAAVGAAAVCGFAESRNVDLPHIEALGTPGTYGVVAYIAGRYMKSKVLSHVATGLLSVAAYKLTAEGGEEGPKGDFVEGEYEAVEGALDDQYAAAVEQANAEAEADAAEADAAEAQDVEEMEPEPETE